MERLITMKENSTVLSFHFAQNQFEVKLERDARDQFAVFRIYDGLMNTHGYTSGKLVGTNDGVMFLVATAVNNRRGENRPIPYLVATAIGELVANEVVTDWRSSMMLGLGAIKMYEHLRNDRDWRDRVNVEDLSQYPLNGKSYRVTKRTQVLKTIATLTKIFKMR